MSRYRYISAWAKFPDEGCTEVEDDEDEGEEGGEGEEVDAGDGAGVCDGANGSDEGGRLARKRLRVLAGPREETTPRPRRRPAGQKSTKQKPKASKRAQSGS
jgi:hypothetical protein